MHVGMPIKCPSCRTSRSEDLFAHIVPLSVLYVALFSREPRTKEQLQWRLSFPAMPDKPFTLVLKVMGSLWDLYFASRVPSISLTCSNDYTCQRLNSESRILEYIYGSATLF